MIRSMTGYGQASAELARVRLSVEVRSVNHRWAEVRLRLPGELGAAEGEIRRKVLQRVARGRVDMTVRADTLQQAAGRALLNRPLLAVVLETAQLLESDFGIQGRPDVGTLLLVPGMFVAEATGLSFGTEEHAALERLIETALAAHDEERRREGRHLQQELLGRLATMSTLAQAIRQRAAALPEILRERLRGRLQVLVSELALEPARLALEASLLADRADVTEEVVRLEAHVAQAQRLLAQPSGEPVGKPLDFLLQEIHRETNTVNSKSADLELSRHAMALKAETEKVREQVQNLE
jgi:uncharacterized protein (TIGR00255 family)